MGGLLARAALGQCAPQTAARIVAMIGLGTPHGGSIGAVQALRATYPVVLRLAAIDRLHDARTLSEKVFHSFVSLYQMLPRAAGSLDLSAPGELAVRGAAAHGHDCSRPRPVWMRRCRAPMRASSPSSGRHSAR